MGCNKCGQCCISNGLIPPWLPGEESEPWLICLVSSLRKHFGDVAEDYPCVFLTDNLGCAIHDVAKPLVCRDFLCENAADAQ